MGSPLVNRSLPLVLPQPGLQAAELPEGTPLSPTPGPASEGPRDHREGARPRAVSIAAPPPPPMPGLARGKPGPELTRETKLDSTFSHARAGACIAEWTFQSAPLP